MKSANNFICTVPFSFTGVQLETRASGLRQVANHTGLVGLQVLMDDTEGRVHAGDTIYVLGTDVKSVWGTKRIKLPSGEEGLFVPWSEVKAVDRKPIVKPPPPPTPIPYN